MRGFHKNTTQDDFRTPDYLIKFVKDTFGTIDRDGACSGENCVARPIDLFSDERMNPGEVLFVNPPWSTPEVIRFVDAAVNQTRSGATAIFLLPNKLCEVAWVNNVNGFFEKLVMLGGRVDFSGPYSVKKGTTRFGTFIGILGKNNGNAPAMESITLRELKKRAQPAKAQACMDLQYDGEWGPDGAAGPWFRS